MKLTILGTGNAMVTKCYNTCFAMEEQGQYFMVDGGGGNQILARLKEAGISWMDIHDIFVTHKHVDHLMGIIWMVRLYCQNMSRGKYDGEVRIYGHEEVISIIRQMSEMVFPAKQTAYLDKKVHLITVEDGEEREILGHKIQFFDIRSTKAKQFGFMMELAEGEKLTCCGDEPYNEQEESYAKGSKWLMHEAFCLYDQAEQFKPYEKHHSTAKDASELAEKLGVQNLILYHTEDQNIMHRKELYTKEGKQYFSGNLYVPDDLEVIEL